MIDRYGYVTEMGRNLKDNGAKIESIEGYFLDMKAYIAGFSEDIDKGLRSIKKEEI